MKLYVGQTQFPRRLEQYAKRFNFAEVRAEPHRLPKLSELNRVRKVLGPEFRFAVALPKSFSNLEWNAEAEKALSFAEKVCATLGAEWLILQTQSTVFPSDRTRRRLAEWATRLAKPERKLGWEPLGVWEPEEGDRWGADLGFHFVTDMSRQPSPEAAVRYARIRSLGEATRLRPYALEVLAENLEACEDATVAFEGEDAARSALSLREILGEHAGGEGADDFDDEFDEGDEFEGGATDDEGESETEGN
ncbi:MAG: DUF72 domain-containing protein [Polyangiaceae bacterium]|nr:DUF72 domain-containing protein [Polyangiaceae bacterium]